VQFNHRPINVDARALYATRGDHRRVVSSLSLFLRVPVERRDGARARTGVPSLIIMGAMPGGGDPGMGIGLCTRTGDTAAAAAAANAGERGVPRGLTGPLVTEKDAKAWRSSATSSSSASRRAAST
jgi:hypothetical protein